MWTHKNETQACRLHVHILENSTHHFKWTVTIYITTTLPDSSLAAATTLEVNGMRVE